MSSKQLKTDRLVLGVVDDGKVAGGVIPLRRLLLVEVDGGARSLLLYGLDLPSPAADAIACWFQQAGVQVERIGRPHSQEEEPIAAYGYADAGGGI